MGIAADRWKYLKALRPNPGRLVHAGGTFFDFRNARKAAYREDAARERLKYLAYVKAEGLALLKRLGIRP